MNLFNTTTLILRKISFLLFLIFSFSLSSNAQGTVLAPGDIMILQIDENDKFIFVTFVDLTVGTTIYFTDCGVFPGTGTFTDTAEDPNYTACPEGSIKFVASSSIEAGTIIQYGDTVDPQFSIHTDAMITGSDIDFTFNGDQVVVFQDTDGSSGFEPSENPSFIFILNANDGNFTSTPNPSSGNESGTSIPIGLTKLNSPIGSATAMAVGTGDGEFDNVIFNGTGLIPFQGSTFSEKVLNAKIAILATPGATNESNGINWYGENNTIQSPDPYFTYEALLMNSSNILPVELISFNGRPKVNTIELEWITASEINNDYFTVEKSTNGIYFKEVTDINGRGTTTLKSIYNWVDQSPVNGLNYYRLNQVDFNGDKTISNIIVIEFDTERGKIQVYPNPTLDEVNLNLPENWEGETSIIIYDFYGRLINSFTITSGFYTLPVNNIPAGMYRLSATNKRNILNTTFIKK